MSSATNFAGALRVKNLVLLLQQLAVMGLVVIMSGSKVLSFGILTLKMLGRHSEFLKLILLFFRENNT